MNKFFNTLSARLAFWYATVFIIFSGIALIIFYTSISTILYEEIDEDLEEDIYEMRSYMNEGGIKSVIKEIQREISSDDPDEVFLRLLDNQGQSLYSTDTSGWIHLKTNPNQLNNIEGIHDFIFISFLHSDEDFQARMVSAQLDDKTYIQLGTTTEDADEFMSLILNIFIGTYLIVTVMASFVGWYIAKKALSGVEAVSNAAIDVANGSLNIRVQIKPQGEEVEKLVTTFNLMLDRIRELITGMQEMTDNIAHDLRSQIGHIRANAEIALSGNIEIAEYQATAADTLEECDRLLDLINTTLDVSEAEVGISRLTMQQVNLSNIVNEAYELFEPIAEDKNIEFYTSIEPDCIIRGHTQYLQRMISNFLDNALKYTPEDGKVGVELNIDDNEVSIIIRDTGIGIDKENQQRIYNRFFRCDANRSVDSNGLGLSFARAIVLAHNGSIELISSRDSGSTFTVKLPV